MECGHFAYLAHGFGTRLDIGSLIGVFSAHQRKYSSMFQWATVAFHGRAGRAGKDHQGASQVFWGAKM